MNDDECEPDAEWAQAEGPPQPPVAIPPEALSANALAGILDAFVLREGTDYGQIERSHESKVQQLRHQLDSGQLTIVYDPNTASVTLVPEREWRDRAHPST